MSQRTHEHERSDAELVRQAQRGDAAAFAELLTRYQDRVFNTCYRMCHNEADALDLAQATFLKVLENLAQFRGRASFYTWLFRIAVNVVLSHRRARLRQAAALDEARDAGTRPAPATVEQHELRERVAWALQQLDEEFRVAVVLKDIEDMDYAAIAEVLSVPVGTVKSRIHRGRLMLRELLRAERTHVGRP